MNTGGRIRGSHSKLWATGLQYFREIFSELILLQKKQVISHFILIDIKVPKKYNTKDAIATSFALSVVLLTGHFVLSYLSEGDHLAGLFIVTPTALIMIPFAFLNLRLRYKHGSNLQVHFQSVLTNSPEKRSQFHSQLRKVGFTIILILFSSFIGILALPKGEVLIGVLLITLSVLLSFLLHLLLKKIDKIMT